jgi:predicted kinase
MNRATLSSAEATVLLGQKGRHTRPVLFLLMGLPGVGKSHVSRILHKSFRFTVLSGENITYALFGTEKCRNQEYAQAYKVLRRLARRYLTQGFSVVVDGTNLRREYREQIYRAATKAGANPYLLEVVAPTKNVLSRLRSRRLDYSQPTAITSACSPAKFAAFKSQVEKPLPSEPRLVLISDDRTKERLTRICRQLQ